MAAIFAPMKFELHTERLSLQMWEETDASWYRELVGEWGKGKPTLEEAQQKTRLFRDSARKNGISLLTIRLRDEGDFIGYCGLIIGRRLRNLK